MKNVNDKIDRQLPILFTHQNGESKTNAAGAVGILLKWDMNINNKLGIGRAHCNDVNILIQESEQEHQHFRIILLEEMISRQSNLDKQQLIETVSIYFIRLMDIIFEFTRTKDLEKQLKIVSEKICLHFQQTFEFIEDFFGSYVNSERKAPFAYIAITKTEIIKKLKKAEADFTDTQDNNNSLIGIVLRAVTEKLSGSFPISVNSIKYISQLAEEIHRQSKPPLEQNLRDILYGLNFNEENFVVAEYERFATLTPDTLSKIERIQLLKQEQKKINQVMIRLNFYWTSTMPSLKEQINGWINEETQFIETATSTFTKQNEVVENSDKIHTSLSVAKLALLIRLLVIDKIIINRTAAPMLRVVTKIFTSLQKESISFGSLETKFHAPDKATINAVRDMLFKWINILGKL